MFKIEYPKPDTMLCFIICLQIIGFISIGVVIGFDWADFSEVNKFEFLNFWLAFLSVLLAIVGLIVPYISYSLVKNRMSELDKKLMDIEYLKNDVTKIALQLSTASIFLTSNDYNGAILEYTKAIKINNKSAGIYNIRGFCKNKAKKYVEAISDFDKAIELDDENANYYNNRGAAKYNLYMYKEAIIDFNKVIELDDTYIMAYLNRGSAKAMIGSIEKNITWLKEAIIDFDKYLEYDIDNDVGIQNKNNASKKIFELEEE